MANEINLIERVDLILASINNLTKNVEHQETPELVDMFSTVKRLTKATEDYQKAAREVIIKRRNEGGTTDKGAKMMAGVHYGVSVSSYPRLSVKKGAYEHLVKLGLEDEVPLQLDAEKAKMVLESLDIPEGMYSEPVVTTALIEELLQRGLIDVSDVENLVDSKETFVIR